MMEFQELVKDAPRFASMERGELVAYAYGMYAAGAKTDAENAKLRELVDGLTWCSEHNCRQECPLYDVSEPDHCREASIKRELGIEVDG